MIEYADRFSEQYNFNNYNLEYKNLSEFRWGGPLYGDLFINHKRIEGKFGGPPFFVEEKGIIILPRFHYTLPNTGCLKIIFFKVPPGFTIAVIKINDNKIYESRKILDAALIIGYKNDVITFYEANHDKNPKWKNEINFDMNNFRNVEPFYSSFL